MVLVHGIGGEWRSWAPLIGPLASEREVVAIDLPGFGESPPLEGERPTPRALAQAIAAFLRAEVGADTVDAVGHSLGGWIALELAQLGVARRVVAIAPGGFWTRREALYARGVLRVAVEVSRRAGPAVSWAVGHRPLRALLASGQYMDPTTVPADEMRRLHEALASSTAFESTLAAMTGQRFSGGPEVRGPVTIVWGKRDGLLLPRQASRAQRAVPGARLVWIPRAGHFAHRDAPEVIVRSLLGG